MDFDIQGLLDMVADHAGLVVAFLGIASLLEAGLGLGAIVPGETFVVLGATVLSEAGLAWVLIGMVIVAIGASGGDHVGWWIGRKAGPPLRNSRLVESMGVDNWDKAMNFVDRQGIFPLVLGRQLPGIRTLISAACGAAHIPYRRFLMASVIGSTIWSLIWVGGGAIFGALIIDILGPVLPWIIVAWILFLVGFAAYKQIKKRRGRKKASESHVVVHEDPVGQGESARQDDEEPVVAEDREEEQAPVEQERPHENGTYQGQ